MNLTDLKAKPISELVKIAESMGLDNVARSRKQDIIFSILKRHAKSGEDIYGDGVLEICLLYTSPSPRDKTVSRMPSSA